MYIDSILPGGTEYRGRTSSGLLEMGEGWFIRLEWEDRLGSGLLERGEEWLFRLEWDDRLVRVMEGVICGRDKSAAWVWLFSSCFTPDEIFTSRTESIFLIFDAILTHYSTHR